MLEGDEEDIGSNKDKTVSDESEPESDGSEACFNSATADLGSDHGD